MCVNKSIRDFIRNSRNIYITSAEKFIESQIGGATNKKIIRYLENTNLKTIPIRISRQFDHYFTTYGSADLTQISDGKKHYSSQRFSR